MASTIPPNFPVSTIQSSGRPRATIFLCIAQLSPIQYLQSDVDPNEHPEGTAGLSEKELKVSGNGKG
jgi:hypothetical protein